MLRRVNRSRHTIELSYLQDDPNFDLFSFDYDYYNPNLKKNFENKFMDYYRYEEIGFETIERFQRKLCAKLNLIMPKYTKEYNAYLEAMKANFMLNKDLKEEFIREYNDEDTSKSHSLDNTNSETSNQDNTNSVHKESVLNNVNADIGDDKLTGMGEDTQSENGLSKQLVNGKSETNSNGNRKGFEKTTFISQGNIGVTSSGQLLEDYWKICRDFDREIIEECWDLFSLF